MCTDVHTFKPYLCPPHNVTNHTPETDYITRLQYSKYFIRAWHEACKEPHSNVPTSLGMSVPKAEVLNQARILSLMKVCFAHKMRGTRNRCLLYAKLLIRRAVASSPPPSILTVSGQATKSCANA